MKVILKLFNLFTGITCAMPINNDGTYQGDSLLDTLFSLFLPLFIFFFSLKILKINYSQKLYIYLLDV